MELKNFTRLQNFSSQILQIISKPNILHLHTFTLLLPAVILIIFTYIFDLFIFFVSPETRGVACVSPCSLRVGGFLSHENKKQNIINKDNNVTAR